METKNSTVTIFIFLYTDVYSDNYKHDCIIQQYVFLKLIKCLSSTLPNHFIAFGSCLCECDAIAQAQCSQMKAYFHWPVIHQYLPLAWAAPLTSAGILLHTKSTKHQPAFLSVY